MKLTTAAASFLLAASVPGVRAGEGFPTGPFSLPCRIPWEDENDLKERLPDAAKDSGVGPQREPPCQDPNPNPKSQGPDSNRRLLYIPPDCHPFTTSTNQDQNLVSCVTTKEDISTTCQDDNYDVFLSHVFLSANNNGQSHHFIVAMMKEVAENNGANNNNCPPTILLDQTHEGEKKIVVLLDDMDYVKNLPRHPIGEASLRDILMAEESAEAIDPSNYDYFYNNCVHYAQRISRSLGFKETKEVGDFVIDNVINDVEGMKIAKKSKGRSLRALATFAIGGKGGYENYVKDVVYSQLNLE